MKFGEPQLIKLKTLTPVFIGNGDSVKPLSYVLEGDSAYVLREDKFLPSLSRQEQDRYLAWIEPLLDRMARLDDQIGKAKEDFERRRQFQRERREVETNLSVQRFLSNELKVNPVRFISERACEDYRVRCRARPERDGFRLHIKDPAHRPYLPGTEIKGALRTSLIYKLVSDGGGYSNFRDRLEDFHRFFRSGASPREKVKRLAKIADNLEADLLRGKKKGEIKNDAKFDFLRFVQVSDSTFLSPADLRVELTQMAGTNRYTSTWIETLAEGREVSFQLLIGDHEIILKELGLEHLRDWLSLPKLFEACFHRSRDILAEEAKYFANEPTISKLITSLQKQNTPQAPLLRLGQGQGFLSITVDLPVRQRDPQLYDEAIREGVSFQRRFRTERGNFPKTRRVIAGGRDIPINLVGWVKLSL